MKQFLDFEMKKIIIYCCWAAGRSENDLGIQDYSEMKVLTRIIKETLRLYPPVAFMGREVSEPIKMSKILL